MGRAPGSRAGGGFRPLIVLAAALTVVGCGVGRPGSGQVDRGQVPTSPAAGAPSDQLSVSSTDLALSRGDRRLPTTVWYPNRSGSYPVVIFGHGLVGVPAVYAQLLTRWAAAGFVVAAPTFPNTSFGSKDFSVLDVPNQPADMAAVLDSLIALDSSNPIRQRLDETRVAGAGHSGGAITALGLFTEDGPEGRDQRFTAGVILAGNSIGVAETFRDPPAPMLFVHADQDPIVPTWTGRSAYARVPWPKAFLTLPGAEHIPPYLSADSPQFDLVVTASTDFLRSTLYGDARAGQRLSTVEGLQSTLT